MKLLKKNIFLILLLTVSISIWAGTFEEVSRVKIEMGQSRNRIGLDDQGGEHWKPLFFSVDKDFLIHIPDFYKGRIAVYDFDGNLVKTIACREGLSPRMNFFTLIPNGRYVTFNDYTLYLLDSQGELLWKNNLGIGFIPSHIYANDVAIFLVPPSGDTRSVVFDYFSSKPLGRFGYKTGKQDIPMISTEKEGLFTFSIEDMAGIPGRTTPSESFISPDPERTYTFLHALRDNRSWWKRKSGGTETLLLYSSTGELLFNGILTIPQTGISGNGFWTFIDSDLNIYKNLYYKKHMEIVRYRIREE